MKVAVITDTHWSCRKSSKLFQDYFELFYKNTFFPKLEELQIDTVIHMGDAFDNRKSIDFYGLEWTKRVVLDPLSKYNVHLINGNHDVYFKSTNRINSPNLLLKQYSNIKVYSDPIELNIGGLDLLFIPWINPENEKQTYDLLRSTNSKVVMGHLELNGFEAHKGHIMEDGMDPNLFNKFTKVFSGHFHNRSDNGRIYYIGNPYEIYFNDVNETRGFMIFDTETLEHTYIDNPYKMHYNLYYDDTPDQIINLSELENKIVRLIVRKKSNVKQFETFVDKLYQANIFELKIIENYSLLEEQEIDADLEGENTFSLLQKFVDESEVTLNKGVLKNILRETYTEACELV
jgi:DNA repair exonuclease SbcCD nuclease subunit